MVSMGDMFFIKFHSSWTGYYYLTLDLKLVSDKSKAATFYLSKNGNLEILNNDTVKITSDDKVLALQDGKLVLIERTQVIDDSADWIITDTKVNNDPICNEKPVLFIKGEQALFPEQYWHTIQHNNGKTQTLPAPDFKLGIVETQNRRRENFQFFLESYTEESNTLMIKNPKENEKTRNILVIVFLLILLLLSSTLIH